MDAEVSVSLDGRPIPAAIAWRGGFGDRAVYKASQLVTVFSNQNGKLNLLQYKKLGVSGNQSQPLAQPGPWNFSESRTSSSPPRFFLGAPICPCGTGRRTTKLS